MIYSKFNQRLKFRSFMIGILAVCFVIVFGGTVAFAQTTFKIGVIDTQQVLDEYKKAKKIDQLLKNAIEKLRNEIKDKDERLRQMQEQLDKQRLFLDDEQKEAKMRNDIRMMQEEIQTDIDNGQKAIDGKRKELVEPLLKEIEDLIKNIGKEKAFSIIIEKNLVVYYVDPKYDLTARALKILNDKYDKEHPEQKKEAKDKEKKKEAPKEDTKKPE